MEEIVKGIEVIAYKGMEFDMTCRDFKYEIGKSYKTDKVKLCNCGFHACLNPKNVFYYYSRKTKSRYFKVKLSGKITKCGIWDTNVAATEITILEEITDNFNEVIETTEWWKNDNVLDLLYWSYGLARVGLKDKYNLIDKQGKFLFEQWFEWVGIFHDGFAKVQRTNGEWNFIDKDGKFLSEQWFELVDDFKEGFAIVEKTIGLRNFIGKDGKLLYEQWFSDAHSFNDGLAVVQRGDGKLVKIDKTGKLIKNCNRIWGKLIKILQ